MENNSLKTKIRAKRELYENIKLLEDCISSLKDLNETINLSEDTEETDYLFEELKTILHNSVFSIEKITDGLNDNVVILRSQINTSKIHKNIIEYKTLDLYNIEKLNQKDISKRLNISQSIVSKIINK